VSGLVSLPADVFEQAGSKGLSITINSFYNIPHIVSRVQVFTIDEFDNISIITLENHLSTKKGKS
jgi:hypothetical protein